MAPFVISYVANGELHPVVIGNQSYRRFDFSILER